jgi:hypothetical protein
MVRLFMTVIFVLVAAVSISAQSRVGFTNLNGFPDVITQQQYNLSAWIKNTGTTSISGNVDVKMQAVGGNVHIIDNNFGLPATLAPGDSVLWTKSNYNFPNGLLAPGQNDVLIWPTKIASASDTLKKPIYFANAAAFSMLETGLETVLLAGIDIDQNYPLAVTAFNIGAKANDYGIGFYYQVGDATPVLMRMREQTIAPESAVSAEVEIPALRSQLEARYGTLGNGFTVPVRIFAEELSGLPYYAAQTVHTEALVIFEIPEYGESDGGPLLYPMPTIDGVIELRHNEEFFEQVASAQLYGNDGRLIATYSSLGKTIDLSAITPGHYLLKIEGNDGSIWTRKIIRQ